MYENVKDIVQLELDVLKNQAKKQQKTILLSSSVFVDLCFFCFFIFLIHSINPSVRRKNKKKKQKKK